VRYVQEYELVVSSRHHVLQSDFDARLKFLGAKAIKANIDRVHLRFLNKARGPVLVELKPTEPATVRYAIRADGPVVRLSPACQRRTRDAVRCR
jgi:hypothetical protein